MQLKLQISSVAVQITVSINPKMYFLLTVNLGSIDWYRIIFYKPTPPWSQGLFNCEEANQIKTNTILYKTILPRRLK